MKRREMMKIIQHLKNESKKYVKNELMKYEDAYYKEVERKQKSKIMLTMKRIDKGESKELVSFVLK